MKVKELLPIIKALDTNDRIHYSVMYSLKFRDNYNSSIVGLIKDYRYSEEEKIITFSNDDTNESINRLLDMEKVLSDIDGETDVVFGHYIHTGKQEKTLITADDYIFSIDNISEEGYIKFDIHYDYLNI